MTPGLPLQAASTAKASSTGGFSVPGRRVVSPFSSVVRTDVLLEEEGVPVVLGVLFLAIAMAVL